LIEISPTYVDTIVRRWERFCGGQALLVGTNQTFSEVAKVRARDATAAIDADYESRTAVPAEKFSDEEAVDE
jgi:hypothetical protein